MKNLDNIIKSRDITLPTKFHLVKAVVYTVVYMYIYTYIHVVYMDVRAKP